MQHTTHAPRRAPFVVIATSLLTLCALLALAVLAL